MYTPNCIHFWMYVCLNVFLVMTSAWKAILLPPKNSVNTFTLPLMVSLCEAFWLVSVWGRRWRRGHWEREWGGGTWGFCRPMSQLCCHMWHRLWAEVQMGDLWGCEGVGWGWVGDGWGVLTILPFVPDSNHIYIPIELLETFIVYCIQGQPSTCFKLL